MLRCTECGRRRNEVGRCAQHPLVAPSVPDPPTDEQPPEVRGYRVGPRLAAGAEGTLWSATDETGAPCCVKVVGFRDTARAHAWARECAMQQRAGPPLAPAVLEWGWLGDRGGYLAMELVAGGTLADRLQSDPAPWAFDRVTQVAAGVLRAVGALHDRGIAHLDLKPENVVCVDDRATLLDFELAIDSSNADVHDAIRGTPEYMAPEQCEHGQHLRGSRSDLYAVAAIIYELVTGTPPFWGTAEEVREAHRSRRPPPLCGGADTGLGKVFERALAKEPGRRFASAAELADALTEALATAEPPAPTRPVRAVAKTRRRHTSVGLLCFATATSTAEVSQFAERHRGCLAYGRGGRFVIAFIPGGHRHPLRGAVSAGRGLVDLGWTERALIDFDEVRIHRVGNTTRVLSPRLSADDIYPAGEDPSGVALTERAAELLPEFESHPRSGPRHHVVVGEAAPLEATQLGLASERLVGRDCELVELADAARTAMSGLPTLATIVGPPSVGKTHFARAVVERLVRGASHTIVALRATEAVLGDHCDVTEALVRRVLELEPGRPGDPREALAKPLGDDPAAVPVGLLLALGWAANDEPQVMAMRAAPGAIRSAIAEAVAAILLQGSKRRALAVVLDDAHRADPALLDAIEAATLAESRGRILACVLSPTEIVHDRPAWGSRAGRTLQLELGPLDSSHAAELIRERLWPAANISDDVVASLADRTAGNPLLIVELARGLHRDGAIRRAKGGDGWIVATDILPQVPRLPIARWLSARELDRQPSGLRRYAALAAVLGPHVDPEFIARVISRLESDGGPSLSDRDPSVAAARLVEQGVLQRGADGVLAFRHAALHEEAAARMEARHVDSVHRAAYLVLESELQASHAPLALLVYHATRCGLYQEAAHHSLTLAMHLADRHAYLGADQHYSVALAHLDPEDPRRLAALHGRGLMRFRLGRYGDAHEDLAHALAEARRVADPLEVDILLDSATLWDWREDYAAAEREAELASRLDVGHSNPRIAARLLLARGRAAVRRGDVKGAMALLDRAAAAASALDDAGYETRVISLLLLAPIACMTGEVDRGRRFFAELLALCTARGDQLHVATAHLNRSFLWVAIDDTESLLRDLEQTIVLARRSGFPLLEARARYNLGEIGYLTGDFGGALEHAEYVVTLQRKLGGVDQRVLVATLLAARCCTLLGRLDDALRRVGDIRAAEAAASAQQREGVALAASDRLLLRAVELSCRTAPREEWEAVIGASERDSVQQEPLEILELAAISAYARGDVETGDAAFDRAFELLAEIPSVMGSRLRNSRSCHRSAIRVAAP